MLFISSMSLGSACAQIVDEYIVQGADLHYKGRLADAQQYFLRALQKDPINEFAMNQLALTYAKQERFSEAMQMFRRVAAQSPRNIFARTWIGVLLLQQNAVLKAKATFMDVLQIDPQNANACYFIGVIHGVERNSTEAFEWFRKAQSFGSDDPEIHFRLAKAFLSMDMPLNARLEFERTLAIAPRHIKAMNELAWVLYNQDFTENAIALWDNALRMAPGNSAVRSSLAKVYNDRAMVELARGNIPLAKALWQKTLVYESGNKAAKYHLRKLGR